ncbi:MAG TPA: TrmB family transcriptional regulator [Dehalococcoidia bacterium]|jgi:DNA-binding MarR family transcriptional regulator|nr:TrmB family transcriptional regulator [Dehalococcoidia bacterium]
MELTSRQKAFLGKMLDLYHEMGEALHYSVLAKSLGVSRSTAYDMLRLLEGKGMVSSEYATPKDVPGPGRSNILFFPTTKARELFSRLAGDAAEQKEWEEVKAHILASLRRGKASDYDDLLRELLNRMPRARSPLAYCAELLTVLLIGVRRVKHKFGQRNPIAKLVETPVTKLNMSILAGAALGLALADRLTRRLLGSFDEYARRYEESLDKLSTENLGALHELTREVADTLATVS